MFEKNIQQKKNINNNIIKEYTSRNNQNDLNRFKTEVNILNSMVNNDTIKNKNNIINNNQFKSFRKTKNNEILKIFGKNNKINNSNKHHRNLSLKNIPITVRNNMNNNGNYTNNKIGKLFEEIDFLSSNKTYKDLGNKKNNNNIHHQKKIIFDYKRK